MVKGQAWRRRLSKLKLLKLLPRKLDWHICRKERQKELIKFLRTILLCGRRRRCLLFLDRKVKTLLHSINASSRSLALRFSYRQIRGGREEWGGECSQSLKESKIFRK